MSTATRSWCLALTSHTPSPVQVPRKRWSAFTAPPRTLLRLIQNFWNFCSAPQPFSSLFYLRNRHPLLIWQGVSEVRMKRYIATSCSATCTICLQIILSLTICAQRLQDRESSAHSSGRKLLVQCT